MCVFVCMYVDRSCKQAVFQGAISLNVSPKNLKKTLNRENDFFCGASNYSCSRFTHHEHCVTSTTTRKMSIAKKYGTTLKTTFQKICFKCLHYNGQSHITLFFTRCENDSTLVRHLPHLKLVIHTLKQTPKHVGHEYMFVQVGRRHLNQSHTNLSRLSI